MDKNFYDFGVISDYEVPIPTENAKVISKKEPANKSTETYEDTLKKAYEQGNTLDSCGIDEDLYDNGRFIDLCGLSLEDAVKANKRGVYIAQDNSIITISLTKLSDNKYEIVFNSLLAVEDDVVISFVLNDETEVRTVTIASGETESHSDIILNSKYASLSNINHASKDTKHNYIIVNTIKDGIFKLCYVVDNKDYKVYNIKFGEPIIIEDEPTKRGHTFSGWSEIPSIMPEEDITIDGFFEKNKYTLTYIVDGETIDSQDILFENAITPKVMKKTGYTFSGWDKNEPSRMPDENITLEGYFTINQYKVTYILNGVIFETKVQDYDTDVEHLNVESRVGYTFSGWKNEPSKIPANDVEVTGQFNINQHIITYKVEGQTDTSITQNYNTIIPRPILVKEGYTFRGWDNEDIVKLPDEDITLTGTFDINSYTITYKDYDNSLIDEQEIEYNSIIVPLEARQRTGYDFIKWIGLPENMPARNIVVTASYKIHEHNFIFMADETGDTVFYSAKTEYNANLKYPTNTPTKLGYTFNTWEAIPEHMPDSELIIRPSFNINKHDIIFACHTDEKKEQYVEICRISDVSYNTSLLDDEILNNLPDDDDIIFKDYYQEGYNGMWPDFDGTMPDNDIFIFAHFLPKIYYVRYYDDNTLLGNEIEVEFRRVLPITANIPDKTNIGLKFVGWENYPTDGLMPAKDISLFAKYEKIKYTIKYHVDGIVINEVPIIYYGDTITPYLYTKEHYTVTPWNPTVPETMPAQDLNFYAETSKNKNTLTIELYFNDGSETSTLIESIEYETNLTNILEQVKVSTCGDKYNFIKWENTKILMPDEELTIKGYFEIKTFEVKFYDVTNSEQPIQLTAITLNYGDSLKHPSEIVASTIILENTQVFIWLDNTNIEIKENMEIKGKKEISLVYYALLPYGQEITEEYITNNLLQPTITPNGLFNYATSIEFNDIKGVDVTFTVNKLTEEETNYYKVLREEYNNVIETPDEADKIAEQINKFKEEHLYSALIIYPYSFTITVRDLSNTDVTSTFIPDDSIIPIKNNYYQVRRYTNNPIGNTVGGTVQPLYTEGDATIKFNFKCN